jgi:hypothetical protein
VAVDAIVDSVSVATTFKAAADVRGHLLLLLGLFQNHRALVRRYLSSVVGHKGQ